MSVRNLTGRAVVRDADEAHRTATPLELFFDLTFVVAVGRVAGELHHQLAEDHVREGIIGFAVMFFAVWWAWMGFTWFASAHDSDDVPHRLLTFVQIAGALVFATGVTAAMAERDFTICVVGYTIMRVGLVIAWLRVARDAPTARSRALRYAAYVCTIQLLWIAWLAVPEEWIYPTFVVLAVAELAIPFVIDHSSMQPVFHAEHIEERHGLFTIILLGESILSAAAGFQIAYDEGGLNAELLTVGLSALVGSFACWWLYFDHPGHLAPTPEIAFRWGYGHVVVFASLAALGAGTHVAAEAAAGHADDRIAALSVAIPAAGFLLGLALLMVLNRISLTSVRIWPKLIGAAVILVCGVILSFAAASAASAAVLAVLALWMMLSGDAISQRQAWAASGQDGERG
jgi:low temperature requirement protein LtrA